jgi:hypothetical protein
MRPDQIYSIGACLSSETLHLMVVKAEAQAPRAKLSTTLEIKAA